MPPVELESTILALFGAVLYIPKPVPPKECIQKIHQPPSWHQTGKPWLACIYLSLTGCSWKHICTTYKPRFYVVNAELSTAENSIPLRHVLFLLTTVFTVLCALMCFLEHVTGGRCFCKLFWDVFRKRPKLKQSTWSTTTFFRFVYLAQAALQHCCH